MVLVDANVILDIATNEPRWFDWSRAQLEPLIDAGEAAISPILYAELVPAAATTAALDTTIVPPGDSSASRCRMPPRFPPHELSPPIVVPAVQRLRPAGLLHRHPCGSGKPDPAHPRRHPLPHQFSKRPADLSVNEVVIVDKSRLRVPADWGERF